MCRKQDCGGRVNEIIKKKKGIVARFSGKCLKCKTISSFDTGPTSTNIDFVSTVKSGGLNVKKTFEALEKFKVQTISLSTFYKTVNKYWNSAVREVYLQKQQSLLAHAQQRPLQLAGDARFDSPGFCAMYGTYIVMGKLIIHISLFFLS